MKIKLFFSLFAALCLIAISSNLSAQVMTESFETAVPPSGWIETTVIGSTPSTDWLRVNTGVNPSCSPHQGTWMAKFNSYDCQDGSERRLRTSVRNFGGLVNSRLSFYMFHDDGYAGNNEYILIQVSSDGNIWANISTPIQRYSAVNGWTKHIINLSAYDGQGTVYIGFLAHSGYGNDMFLDNVEIYQSCITTPTGTLSRCTGSGSDNYTTSSSGATSFQWNVTPSNAGTFSGTGTTGTLTWNASFSGNATITAQALNGSCSRISDPLNVLVKGGIFSLSNPTDGAYVVSTPTFQWSTSNGSSSYDLYIDGLIKKSGITGNSYTLQSSESLSEGTHSWYVKAENCTQSFDTRNIIVDANPPTVFNLISPANNSSTTTLQPTLSWSASSDVLSGLAKYQLWIDGILNQDNIPIASTSIIPANNLTNGTHSWQIVAVDNAGNIRNSTQIWNVIYQSCITTPTGPQFARCIGAGSDNFTTSSAGATLFQWTVSPGTAGAFSGTGSTGTLTWNATFSGTATITVQALNGTCTLVSDPINFTIGATAGAFTLSNPANNTFTSATPTFQWTASTGATSYVLIVDNLVKKSDIIGTSYTLLSSESLTQSVHSWKVKANGCTQSSNSQSINVDVNPPSSFNLISPTNNSWSANTYQTFSWSASSDANSGLAYYQLWIDGYNYDNLPTTATSFSPWSLSDGFHSWYVVAVDNVGNTKKSTQTYTVKIDNTPPQSGVNTCLNFNGTNYQYVDVNDGVYFNGNFTIEAWVNVRSYNNSSKILDFGNGNPSDNIKFELSSGTSGKPDLLIYNGTSSSTLTFPNVIPTDTWTHIAVSLNGNIATGYVDGVQVSTNTNMKIPYGVTRYNCYIGRSNNPSSAYPNANYDEIRIWNTARTVTEISSNMYNVLSGCETGIESYWRFNEGGGTTVYDQSINHHNGTIYGAVYQGSPITSTLCVLKTPTAEQYLPITTPTFSWERTSDAGIGFQKFQLWIDCTLIKDNLSDSTWTVTSPLAYGKHTWNVRGYDSLGNNQQSDFRTFFIDNQSPNIFSLTSPTNNQIVGSPTPDLSWASTTDYAGGCGMSKYQVWINGVLDADNISPSTNLVQPYNSLSEGTYTWFVKAFDNLGNVRQSSQTWTFYVDWSPPTDFSLVSPSDDQTLTISRPTFVWNHSSDIGSGLVKYELNISGYAPIIISATDTSYLSLVDLPNGTYTWFVKAYDLANSSTSSNYNTTFTFTINVPLPEQPAAPTGTSSLCVNPSNTDYSTTGANYAASYLWYISPSNAGTIIGTGTTVSIDWNNTFTGTAQITVKGHNNQGDGIISSALSVVINSSPGAASIPSGSQTLCINSANSGYLTTVITNTNSYIWSISPVNAGTITGSSTTASIDWDNAFFGTATINVKGQNDCGFGAVSPNLTVTINPLPSQAATPTGTLSICQNSANTIYSTIGAANATSYTWDLQPTNAGTVTLDVTQKNATIDWNNSFTGSASLTVFGQNNCGNGLVSQTLNVSINICNVTGTLSYFNTSGTKLNGVDVKLMSGITQVALSTTDVNGNYSFSNIPDGVYTFTATTTKPWGGVTATDALKMKRHIASLELFTEPIRLTSADVNLSGTINSTDVLKVQRRIASLDFSFTRPDWVYEKPVIGGNSLSVSGSNITQNFYALCTGDVNSSYIPSLVKQNNNYLTLQNENKIEIVANKEFELPVKVANPLEIGACQLFLNYNSDLFDVIDITMSNPYEDLIYNVQNDVIKIVWVSINPISLNTNDVLFNLKMKAKNTTSLNTDILLNDESELSNSVGNIIESAKLLIPAIAFNDINSITQNNSNSLEFSIYPNPVKNELIIETNFVTKQKCEILNILGEIIYISSVYKTTTFNTSQLSSGIYFVKIHTDKLPLVKRFVKD